MLCARSLVVGLCAALGLLLVASPAGAGGSTLRFEREWYAAGEVARASGTISWTNTPGRGWLESGPYFAFLTEGTNYLAAREARQVPEPFLPSDAIPLGEIAPEPGPSSLTRAFTLEFAVPQVAPGWYAIVICNESCSLMLGDQFEPILQVADPANPPPPGANPPWEQPTSEIAQSTTPPPSTVAASPAPVASAAPTTRAASTDDGRGFGSWWIWPAGLGIAVALGGVARWLVRRAGTSSADPPSDGPSLPPEWLEERERETEKSKA